MITLDGHIKLNNITTINDSIPSHTKSTTTTTKTEFHTSITTTVSNSVSLGTETPRTQ